MKYNITPVAKPRMTQSDKWKVRPATQRYWAYKDEIRRQKVYVPVTGAKVLFFLPMPKSWPKYHRLKMCGLPHQQKPDIDNLIKGLLDAIYQDDCVVWHIEASKFWHDKGAMHRIC